MKIQAIIPTAGSGLRFQSKVAKQFIEIGGVPLCVFTLKAFERTSVIDSLIVVAEAKMMDTVKDLIDQYGLKKIAHVVAGGKMRSESVANGIKALDEDTDIVVVHDGVRPLVSSKIIEDTVGLCRKHGAAVSAVPVKSTIKTVDKTDLSVVRTLIRDELWEVQTPQAFKRETLVRAHKNRGPTDDPTDDAVMVEAMGVKVMISPGDYRNIKVTTKEDLTIAEAFLRQQDRMAARS